MSTHDHPLLSDPRHIGRRDAGIRQARQVRAAEALPDQGGHPLADPRDAEWLVAGWPYDPARPFVDLARTFAHRIFADPRDAGDLDLTDDAPGRSAAGSPLADPRFSPRDR